jgi:hypothetical protein
MIVLTAQVRPCVGPPLYLQRMPCSQAAIYTAAVNRMGAVNVQTVLTVGNTRTWLGFVGFDCIGSYS